ncbi:glutathione S-transferase family protein [Brevundimonas sp. 2R-24]|uniref:Glutathione S-transferase family protein n=1 Tax=Peiella sedimenti TaxID=3061083 RepID=A0ABT8SN33_9CAUL|nr:glutathione S-transferase family protein [Caulobacteraceae bacterium XZ-24]
MKLYTTPMAPNPRRVAWLLAEKGVDDIEVVTVNLLTGEHRTPDYRAKAGSAHVPVLEFDDGGCIAESLAICRYLESLYPEPNLLGRDPRETAEIEMWTRRAELYLANPMMISVRFEHPALSALEPPNPEVGAYNRATAERMMKSLDRRLADQEWIAAGRFSLADIVAYTGIDFGRLVKYRPSKDLVHLNRWREAMKARPAAAAGMSMAG